ncbi:probable inactive protein kinase DDB_G0270444 [Drosophila bipectinata]|uniref:probable inactive protein kinase DDB_G0270444 n=1 Tax=Drosophila bipectinata TaxID=42026 RepID=UPI001C88EB92|nr:uncharacterized protein LOC108125109 [Drosophila bipectinata]
MMASCDVQSSPSQEELKQKETIKNVKNSEERDQAKASSQDEMTAAVALAAAAAIETDPSPISEGEVRSVSSTAKMTKIPGPVLPGPSGSFIQTTKRHYSSVLRLAKSHTSVASGKDLERDQNRSNGSGQNTTDDSGINMEFSISDVEPSCSGESGPILETILQAIPTTTSELEMELAEQQTLKELQRVVAEMEAEVALDDLEEMQKDETHSDEQPIFEVLPEVEAAVEEANQEGIQNSLGYAELKSLHEPDPGAAEEASKESVKLEEFKPSQDLFEQLDSEASTEKPTTSGGGAPPKSFIEEQLQKSVEESIVDPCLERAKQLIEELQVALRAAPETDEEKFKREQLENSDPASPAGFLGQKFPHQVQADGATEVVPEVASTEVADEDLSATSEVALVERPSQVSHMDGSVGSDRRMVSLEQLLDAERNVELLRQLLQGGPDVDEAASDMITDTEAYSEETDSIATEEDDDEDENENEIVTGDEVASENTEEEMMKADSETEKPSSYLFAMMQRLAGNKMARISYPLLFCGLAISLIYLSRKV